MLPSPAATNHESRVLLFRDFLHSAFEHDDPIGYAQVADVVLLDETEAAVVEAYGNLVRDIDISMLHLRGSQCADMRVRAFPGAPGHANRGANPRQLRGHRVAVLRGTHVDVGTQGFPLCSDFPD